MQEGKVHSDEQTTVPTVGQTDSHNTQVTGDTGVQIRNGGVAVSDPDLRPKMFALRRLMKEYKGKKADLPGKRSELRARDDPVLLPPSPSTKNLVLAGWSTTVPHTRAAGCVRTCRCRRDGWSVADAEGEEQGITQVFVSSTCLPLFAGTIFSSLPSMPHPHDCFAVHAEVSQNAPHGIIAGPVDDDNFFEWEAVIA